MELGFIWASTRHTVRSQWQDPEIFVGEPSGRRDVVKESSTGTVCGHLALVLIGRLRPSHYGELRQPDSGRDMSVRLVLPRRGPDQVARQRRQSEPHLRVEPYPVRGRLCA